ncbi:hypothetical protein PUNSTDRAFT_71944 [Punctularia strigosozonata HHB-11173 SS5]|uniref:uncharacterized protein n=1 Tax=Punctularia strigosozonata (strain HHB-11173) TaxID=741275 RepID=UPI0004417C24|nr:uncharacterized protein PUNSTDRAFT_71944 [Punctularia strigosozonata HHB-11173 SS5]EIN06724.1 hypothetical protein PUNSTDRAFT_71944 [Punctularia strigosozonata HHB-11173 SS5]
MSTTSGGRSLDVLASILSDPNFGDRGDLEKLLLAKVFSQSMHPSDITPFFYRASKSPQKDDITITTIVTPNRLQRLADLVDHYQGPVSAAVHISTSNATACAEMLTALHGIYRSGSLRRYLDVHLVLDPFDRQFNTWRNIARLFARTDYVMLLDVDFWLCTDFGSALKKRASREVVAKLDGGNAALVIPAFEYTKQEEGRDPSLFPRDKETLLSLVRQERLGMFHRSWAPGHNSTDYNRYYAAPPGQVYRVTQYQAAYEPYVIFKKDGPPWCDERFVGYGGNKAACLFEMYISGMSFYVLADHFIIHQSHAYEEEARRVERKYNRKVYADFKEETCIRYIRRFYEEGTLGGPDGYNAQSECTKIKSVVRFVSEVEYLLGQSHKYH